MRWWCLVQQGYSPGGPTTWVQSKSSELRILLATRVSTATRMLAVLADPPMPCNAAVDFMLQSSNMIHKLGAGPLLRWACILRLFLNRVVMVPRVGYAAF